jgi:hypothetical protein
MSRSEEQLTPDQWAELKNILLAEERKRIDKLEDNWTFPDGFSTQVANVLPLSVDKAEKKDEELTETLYPVVEKSIYRSVKTNIQPMADALFPVMGPAIRKAIQDAMRKTVESLNQTLESSFTVKGIKWRLQAKATGRSYAEIVLKNTLLFRVEQVFLIHRGTGLLIAHESINPLHDENSDMISSMLTAIQDFVRDSFKVDDSQNLESIQVGSASVWLEQSPNVILAAVVEGEPPLSLRDLMRETLEEVHHRFGRMLNDFDGDTTPYKPAHRIIGQCLISEAKESSKKKGVSPALIVALFLLAVFGTLFTMRAVDRHRWNEVIGKIKAEPGLVVLNQGRSGTHFHADILRDHRAPSPASLVPGKIWKIDSMAAGSNPFSEYVKLKPTLYIPFGKDTLRLKRNLHIDFTLRPFVSSDPKIVLQTLEKKFGEQKELNLNDTVNPILISGFADKEWILEVKRSGILNQSYVPIDISRVWPMEGKMLPILQKALDTMRFQFGFAKTELNPVDLPRAEELKNQVSQLNLACQIMDVSFTMTVVGRADAVGSPEQNRVYAGNRANLFLTKYLPAGLDRIKFIGVPDTADPKTLTKEQERTVTFNLIKN